MCTQHKHYYLGEKKFTFVFSLISSSSGACVCTSMANVVRISLSFILLERGHFLESETLFIYFLRVEGRGIRHLVVEVQVRSPFAKRGGANNNT